MGPVTNVQFRRLGLPVLLVTAVLGMSACGDDDEESTSAASDETTTEASTEEVTVTATEYEFALSATPAEETKSVTFQNDGEEFHVMIFAKINEGFTTAEAFELEGEKGSAEIVGQAEADPGKGATVDIRKPLGPGSYAILCPLRTKDGELHYELGQLQEFDLG